MITIKLNNPIEMNYANVVSFFKNTIEFTSDDNYHITCEFTEGKYRSGSAYGQTQYDKEGIWKIIITVSDYSYVFPSGNSARLWTYEQILIHEILHELWFAARLGDIHEKNFGVLDNQKVYDYLLSNTEKPLIDYFNIKSTNMKPTKKERAKLFKLIFRRDGGEEYDGYDLAFMLDVWEKSEEWQQYSAVFRIIKKLENWARKLK